MREIKFRAFVHKYQSISIVDSIDFENKEILFGVNAGYMETDSESASFEDIELMEFTGMRDRKGNMIFEGDILKIERVNSDFLIIVSYKIEDKRFSGFGFIEGECEIIGNIHENPEIVIKSLPF